MCESLKNGFASLTFDRDSNAKRFIMRDLFCFVLIDSFLTRIYECDFD